MYQLAPSTVRRHSLDPHGGPRSGAGPRPRSCQRRAPSETTQCPEVRRASYHARRGASPACRRVQSQARCGGGAAVRSGSARSPRCWASPGRTLISTTALRMWFGPPSTSTAWAWCSDRRRHPAQPGCTCSLLEWWTRSVAAADDRASSAAVAGGRWAGPHEYTAQGRPCLHYDGRPNRQPTNDHQGHRIGRSGRGPRGRSPGTHVGRRSAITALYAHGGLDRRHCPPRRPRQHHHRGRIHQGPRSPTERIAALAAQLLDVLPSEGREIVDGRRGHAWRRHDAKESGHPEWRGDHRAVADRRGSRQLTTR